MSAIVSHLRPLPPPGLAEVRITAASPDVAREVAQALRQWFGGAEQRSYPIGEAGGGTRLHLTVDTTSTPESSPETFQSWLVAK
jgi:hypothetical protein